MQKVPSSSAWDIMRLKNDPIFNFFAVFQPFSRLFDFSLLKYKCWENLTFWFSFTLKSTTKKFFDVVAQFWEYYKGPVNFRTFLVSKKVYLGRNSCQMLLKLKTCDSVATFTKYFIWIAFRNLYRLLSRTGGTFWNLTLKISYFFL